MDDKHLPILTLNNLFAESLTWINFDPSMDK